MFTRVQTTLKPNKESQTSRSLSARSEQQNNAMAASSGRGEEHTKSRCGDAELVFLEGDRQGTIRGDASCTAISEEPRRRWDVGTTYQQRCPVIRPRGVRKSQRGMA